MLRFRASVDLAPRGIEQIALDAALGRVLAADVVSPVDVPSFDRSNVDGFALIAEDTFGASEEVPRRVCLADEVIHTGVVPATVVRSGEAVAIATGGMMPRGADAVVMVEHADVEVKGEGSKGEGGRGRGKKAANAHSQGGDGRQRRLLRGHGHHRRRNRAAPRTGPDQPRHRRARGDWRRARRCLAKADRRHSVDRRRNHRARPADGARARLRLERASACRRRSRAGRRAPPPRHHARR